MSVTTGDAGEGTAQATQAPIVFRTHRLEAFSDGVMAVIITIMAFELKVPARTDLSALRHEVPLLLVYVLSFTNVGIYWNNHHHLLRRTERISGAVMWANLDLLFWLSLIPVLTEWVGKSYRQVEPAVCYGAVALAAAVAYWVLVRAILRANDPQSGLSAAIGSDVKGIASILLYAAAIGFAYVTPYIAYSLYFLVAVVWVVPDRRLVR
jgi:uncharacterized membrane protein